MKLIYRPSYTDGYAKIAGQDVAMLILLPDEYSATKKWPVKIFCHGKGQVGPGTKAALDMVYSGQYQAIPDSWKTEIDQLGIIGVLVNYNDFFQPASWRFVDIFLRANYNVVDKFLREGFSWGGGSLNRASQQADIAATTALWVMIAPTVEAGDTIWSVPAKSGSMVWVHVNAKDPNNPQSKGDDVVGQGPAESIVKGINASVPVIKATLTEYIQDGHGGTNEAVSNTPPPGYAESVTQLYLRILAGDMSLPKTGIIAQPPPPVITTVKAITSYTISGNTVHLIGSKSTGYTQGYDGTWELVSAPEGITSKLIFPTGSSYIDATGNLPVEGTYVFKFSLKGADPVNVTVIKGAPTIEKIPDMYTLATKTLHFTDGSTITVKAVFTDATGKMYTV